QPLRRGPGEGAPGGSAGVQNHGGPGRGPEERGGCLGTKGGAVPQRRGQGRRVRGHAAPLRGPREAEDHPPALAEPHRAGGVPAEGGVRGQAQEG
ncbi:unnamed protein product, partial [Symbiodinium sp. CCMP2456]